MIIRHFIRPVRFDILNRWLIKPDIKILDVGCGQQSASETRKYYPNCKYYGIDMDDIKKSETELMEKFYKLNLDKSDLKMIPDDFFDFVMMSHIIEHTNNGEKIVKNLLKKLKKGGIIYIETPTMKSTKAPSRKGTLNFYDDPTHKRVYESELLQNLLKDNDCEIIAAKVRRSPKRILLLPLYCIASKIKHGFVSGGPFWDIMGIAHYVIAKKK